MAEATCPVESGSCLNYGWLSLGNTQDTFILRVPVIRVFQALW